MCLCEKRIACMGPLSECVSLCCYLRLKIVYYRAQCCTACCTDQPSCPTPISEALIPAQCCTTCTTHRTPRSAERLHTLPRSRRAAVCSQQGESALLHSPRSLDGVRRGMTEHCGMTLTRCFPPSPPPPSLPPPPPSPPPPFPCRNFGSGHSGSSWFGSPHGDATAQARRRR